MGTKTFFKKNYIFFDASKPYKKQNPLMGTKTNTCNTIWNSNTFQYKKQNPLMGTKTLLITALERTKYIYKKSKSPNGDENSVFLVVEFEMFTYI